MFAFLAQNVIQTACGIWSVPTVGDGGVQVVHHLHAVKLMQTQGIAHQFAGILVISGLNLFGDVGFLFVGEAYIHGLGLPQEGTVFVDI